MLIIRASHNKGALSAEELNGSVASLWEKHHHTDKSIYLTYRMIWWLNTDSAPPGFLGYNTIELWIMIDQLFRNLLLNYTLCERFWGAKRPKKLVLEGFWEKKTWFWFKVLETRVLVLETRVFQDFF